PLRIAPLTDVDDLSKVFEHRTRVFEVRSLAAGEDEQPSILDGRHAANHWRVEQARPLGLRLATKLLRDVRTRGAGVDEQLAGAVTQHAILAEGRVAHGGVPRQAAAHHLC